MDVLTKILSAAAELFRQYGFKTITMDDIARRAGISKKTLYQHFANKNEVIHESLSWYMEHMVSNCTAIVSNAENAVAEMIRLIELFDQNHKHTNPLVFLELQRYYPEAYELFRVRILEKNVEILRENIIRGMEDGLYRTGLNPDLMARFHIEASLLAFQPTLLVNDHHDLRYVNRELCEHFMYGIMTHKGEKLYQKYKAQYLKQ